MPDYSEFNLENILRDLSLSGKQIACIFYDDSFHFFKVDELPLARFISYEIKGNEVDLVSAYISKVVEEETARIN